MPVITSHTVDVADAAWVRFIGELLGTTESRQDIHTHDTPHAARGQRCYACRWSEYRIYRVREYHENTPPYYTGRYLVVSYGQSIVPGETTFRRVVATNSPAEVLELLTTRKHGQRPVITAAAARLLARASDQDAGIQEAWDNRVVQ